MFLVNNIHQIYGETGISKNIKYLKTKIKNALRKESI
jgi:hypothetical protein